MMIYCQAMDSVLEQINALNKQTKDTTNKAKQNKQTKNANPKPNDLVQRFQVASG